MLFERYEQEAMGQGVLETTPRVIDGILVDDEEVWLIVARQAEDLDEWLTPAVGAGQDPELRMCRAVIDGDTLLLGGTDPERDVLLSELGGTA